MVNSTINQRAAENAGYARPEHALADKELGWSEEQSIKA